MRFHNAFFLAVASLALVSAATSDGQVFDITAGASTVYGAQGGTVVIHGEHSDTTIGGGVVQGHFAAGGNSVHPVKGGTGTVGQQDFEVNLPTDLFKTGHALFGTGVGIRLDSEPQRSFSSFVGMSSQVGGTPLFQTSSLERALAFARWKHPQGKRCLSVSTALFSKRWTALESVQCTWSHAFTYAATAGTGANAPYAAASLFWKLRRLELKASYISASSSFQRGNDVYQPTPEPVRENISAEYKLTSVLTVSGQHEHFLTPAFLAEKGQVDSLFPIRSNLDTASLQYQNRKTGFGVTFLRSASGQDGQLTSASCAYGSSEASSASFRRDFGKVQWTEQLLHTFGGGNSNSILINGLGATVNPHVRLTESINFSGNGTTFSHGGALLTSFSKFEVDYQLFYLVTRPEKPFQQAMVFDAQVSLPRTLALRAMSSIGATGQTLYTLQLTTSLAHNVSLAEPISQGGLGLNTLSGRVVNSNGEAVEGAALMIGASRVYTDSDGYFFLREKHSRSHPVRVLTDEFLDVGSFVVRSAPKEIRTHAHSTDEIIVIVVDHLKQKDGKTNLATNDLLPVSKVASPE